MSLLKPIRVTLEFEETPDGTRITEYWRPDPTIDQRLVFGLTMRMLGGTFAESQASLRSTLAAAAGSPPTAEA